MATIHTVQHHLPLHRPVALAFRPNSSQLYIANMDNDSLSIFDTSTSMSMEKKDTLAYHYMTHVSSLAFNANGTEFATCQDSTNRYAGPEAWDSIQDWRWNNIDVVDANAQAAEGVAGNQFMGPSLWRTSSYALANQQYGNHVWYKDANGTSKYGSHIDMLHQSPRCVGITYAGVPRVYFAVDDGWGRSKQHGSIVRYDFSTDHGEGGSDHTTAKVWRYRGFVLTRMPGVASQIVFDLDTTALYVADTGGGRIVKLNVSSGVFNTEETPPYSIQNQPLDEYKYVDIQTYWVLGKGIVTHPSGLALRKETSGEMVLFVSDFGTSMIHVLFASNGEVCRPAISVSVAYGLSGLTFGSDGTLWAVHAVAPALFTVKGVADVAGRPSFVLAPEEEQPANFNSTPTPSSSSSSRSSGHGPAVAPSSPSSPSPGKANAGRTPSSFVSPDNSDGDGSSTVDAAASKTWSRVAIVVLFGVCWNAMF